MTWFVDAANKYSLQLWGKNLTNAEYATTLGSSAQSDYIALAPGRTYGMTLVAKF